MKKTDDNKKGRNRAVRQCLGLFWEFFKIGLFTIGGGMAMIPQIQQVVVKDREWLTEEEMVDCIAVSQAMPGVIAINSATYIGKRTQGIWGAIAATLGVVMPSFLIILIVVTLLGAVGENQYVTGAFTGIKAAVCGLILVTTVRLGKQILRTVFQWVLAIAALIVIAVFGVTAVWAILAGALLGILYQSIKMRRQRAGQDAEAAEETRRKQECRESEETDR